MSYTLDPTFVISIGIIEFFQLVSIWHLFVYSYVFYICMLTISISIDIWLLHTYIDVSFVPIIFLYFRAQILILHSLIFNDYIVSIDEFLNWYLITSLCMSFFGIS